jgi:hypothetical protein
MWDSIWEGVPKRWSLVRLFIRLVMGSRGLSGCKHPFSALEMVGGGNGGKDQTTESSQQTLIYFHPI